VGIDPDDGRVGPALLQTGHDPHGGQAAAGEDQGEAPVRAGERHGTGDGLADAGHELCLTGHCLTGRRYLDLDRVDLPAPLPQAVQESACHQLARRPGHARVLTLDLVRNKDGLNVHRDRSYPEAMRLESAWNFEGREPE
jgi:hypothetical protein